MFFGAASKPLFHSVVAGLWRWGRWAGLGRETQAGREQGNTGYGECKVERMEIVKTKDARVG